MLEDSPGITLFLFALPMILGNLVPAVLQHGGLHDCGQFVGEGCTGGGWSFLCAHQCICHDCNRRGNRSLRYHLPVSGGRRRQEDENLRVYGAAYLLAMGIVVGVFGFRMNRQILICIEYAGKYSGGGRNLSGNSIFWACLLFGV